MHNQTRPTILQTFFAISIFTFTSVAQAGVAEKLSNGYYQLTDNFYTHSLPRDPNARLKAGLNASFNNAEYNTSETMTVMPQFFYDNNRLYAEGSEAGVYGFKDNKNQLRFGLTYDGQSFDPEDSEDNHVKKLNERKWSALAGASYMHITPIGGIKLKVATDILDRHSGTVVTLAHLTKFNVNKWTIYPELGLKWNDESYNDYYYGVSQKESEKSGLPAYQAESSVNPYANLTGNYAFDDHLSGFISQHIGYLADTQHDSPMVDSRTDLVTRVGFNYQF